MDDARHGAVRPSSLRAVPYRYCTGEVLGFGGMGEVRQVTDRVVGREVAMKFVREGGSAARFLREARVQGQLEHPSIVPLYDIGTDEDGAVYFTMRRIRGTTLRDILRQRGEQTISTHKLLSAFAQLCLALDYAHSRGVVHRDLKPANIMLGHFGEVYVLDWGLAKISDADEPVNDVGDAETSDEECIGTPGYMAPEQVCCEQVDARADVYSLGVILYEILTLTPLHLGTIEARLFSTLEPVDPARLRHLPAGVAAIITHAVTPSVEDRYSTARELYEDVEAYLGGSHRK